jgi:hypothetical protein
MQGRSAAIPLRIYPQDSVIQIDIHSATADPSSPASPPAASRAGQGPAATADFPYSRLCGLDMTLRPARARTTTSEITDRRVEVLKLEPDDTVTYKGKVVAKHVHDAGEDTVEITLTYKTPPGEWVIPLAYLASGLQKIEPPPPPVALDVVTSDDDIEGWFDVPRLMIEKTIKRDGYIWVFHKADPDPWPSRLHGHDYDKALKLDALTGDIYDVASRRKCAKLTRKSLGVVHSELLESKDLKALSATYLRAAPP